MDDRYFRRWQPYVDMVAHAMAGGSRDTTRCFATRKLPLYLSLCRARYLLAYLQRTRTLHYHNLHLSTNRAAYHATTHFPQPSGKDASCDLSPWHERTVQNAPTVCSPRRAGFCRCPLFSLVCCVDSPCPGHRWLRAGRHAAADMLYRLCTVLYAGTMRSALLTRAGEDASYQ